MMPPSVFMTHLCSCSMLLTVLLTISRLLAMMSEQAQERNNVLGENDGGMTTCTEWKKEKMRCEEGGCSRKKQKKRSEIKIEKQEWNKGRARREVTQQDD